MSRQLFLLTVTPVQAFIAASRKTQDLYAGSRILSRLCLTAIHTIKSRYQAQIMYPSENIDSLPNRVLALVESDGDREKLMSMGRDIEDAIRGEFADMADAVIRGLGLEVHSDLRAQIEQYLQIYWVFCPLDGKTYAEAYREITAVMGAIKNTKIFGQLAEAGRKCSVTGEQNALYYKNDPKRNRAIAGAIRVPDDIPDKYFAPGEALGGIALVKRGADKFFERKNKEYNSRFPSTSRVALMDAFHRLAEADSNYKNILNEDFDEQYIYRKKYGNETVKYDARADEIYKQFDKYNIDFTSYYAVLLFDGDSMGEWLSGAKLENKNKDLQAFHWRLSEELGKFAKQAESVLVPPRGITVYAGGDDFLGFVNLSHLLDVMKTLRESFDRSVDLSEFTDQKLTFSAGIAIAHYKIPLSEVLAWARKMMEGEAKKLDTEKDAFGIALLRHSGEISKTVYKWKADHEWTTDLLKKLIHHLRHDISSTFNKTFHLEFRPLMNEKGQLDPAKISDEMVRLELKRLIRRAEPKRRVSQEEHVQKTEALLETLWNLYLSGRSFEHFLSLLDLALFLEREMKSGA